MLRRSVRITLAALIGFYPGLWVFHQPVFATYSLFTAIALGGLSTVSGEPAQRTRIYLTAALVGAGLAAVGTWTAATLAGAVTGMFVIAVVIGLSAIVGPRVTGISGGLQLFYILACFPPYLPRTLGPRLAGIAVGAALVTAADRLLWPEPGPPSYDMHLARTLELVAEYAALLRPSVGADSALSADSTGELRRAGDTAQAAMDGMRLSTLPLAERPLSPSRRDRARRNATESLRYLHRQLRRVEQLVGTELRPNAAAVTAAVAGSLRDCACAVRREGPPPRRTALRAALARLDAARRDTADDVTSVRIGGRLSLAAGAGFAVTEHCRVLLGVPPTLPASMMTEDDTFGYVGASNLRLYLRHLRGEFSVRSVTLQNAVRMGVVLAGARLVAGVLDVSHGFWVLLAALTLMRTSAQDTRATLRPAFVGTLIGALIGGVVIVTVGPERWVYAVLTPAVMLAAFVLGPRLGLAWGQAGFAVVVSVVFMQLAPATWHLAETRLLDVVLGGLTGAVAGVLTWPRGGGGELRRALVTLLDEAPALLRATVSAVAGTERGTPADPVEERRVAREAHQAWHFAEDSYVQYRAERPDSSLDETALLQAVDTGRFLLRGAAYARLRYPTPAQLPPPVVTGLLDIADRAAARIHERGAVLRGGPPPQDASPDLTLVAVPPGVDGCRVADLEAWMFALLTGPALPVGTEPTAAEPASTAVAPVRSAGARSA